MNKSATQITLTPELLGLDDIEIQKVEFTCDDRYCHICLKAYQTKQRVVNVVAQRIHMASDERFDYDIYQF